MSSIRFVHTADLHLDRQFRGLRGTPSTVRDAIRDATLTAYRKLIDFTIDQQADALLVSGDIYDGDDRSLRAQLAFVEGVERLDAAGIRTFICHGESDPLDDWTSRMRFPPLVHTFGAGVEAVSASTEGDVEVLGVSYPPAAPAERLARSIGGAASPAPLSIGMFHGDVGDSIEAMSDLNVDYWALGGRHQPEIPRQDGPAVVYPGAIQGTQPGEDEAHGVWLVELDQHGMSSIRFEALDVIRWTSINVGSVNESTETAVLDSLAELVEARLNSAQGRPIIYQISLETPALPDERDPRDLVRQLNERFGHRRTFAWCYRLGFRPAELVDRERRKQAGDIVAQLLQLRDSIMLDPVLEQRFWGELAVLLDDDRFERYRSRAGLSEDQLAELIQDAEAAVLAAIGTTS